MRGRETTGVGGYRWSKWGPPNKFSDTYNNFTSILLLINLGNGKQVYHACQKKHSLRDFFYKQVVVYAPIAADVLTDLALISWFKTDPSQCCS